jgi:hypothetical protein
VGGRLEGELGRVGGELIRIDSLATKNPMQIWLNAGVIAKIARERNVKLIHARSRAPGWSAYWAAKPDEAAVRDDVSWRLQCEVGHPRSWYNSVMVRGDRVIANSDYHCQARDRGSIPRGGEPDRDHPSRGVDIAQILARGGFERTGKRCIIAEGVAAG